MGKLAHGMTMLHTARTLRRRSHVEVTGVNSPFNSPRAFAGPNHHRPHPNHTTPPVTARGKRRPSPPRSVPLAAPRHNDCASSVTRSEKKSILPFVIKIPLKTTRAAGVHVVMLRDRHQGRETHRAPYRSESPADRSRTECCSNPTPPSTHERPVLTPSTSDAAHAEERLLGFQAAVDRRAMPRPPSTQPLLYPLKLTSRARKRTRIVPRPASNRYIKPRAARHQNAPAVAPLPRVKGNATGRWRPPSPRPLVIRLPLVTTVHRLTRVCVAG